MLRKPGCEKMNVSVSATGRVDKKRVLAAIAEENRVRKDECIRSGHRSGRQKKGAWRSLLRKTGCEKMNVSVPATGRVDKERVLAAIAEENRVRKGERIRSGYRSGR